MAKKVALTDGHQNLVVQSPGDIRYLESLGWQRVIPAELDPDEEPETVPEVKEGTTGTTEAASPAPEAQALAEAAEKASAPRKTAPRKTA